MIAAPHPRATAAAPLGDVTVVEAYAADAPLALRLAGSFAGRIAADLGARVVKYEEPNRRPDRLTEGMPATAAFLDAGKEILPADRAALGCLLERADVAILDAELHASLATSCPIVTVLSMFKPGVTAAPASEFTILALGGLLDIVGDPEREPLRLGGHQAAYAAGLAAYAGIAAALCQPPAARPETVMISLLDTAIWINWKSAAPAGPHAAPRRAGAEAEWQAVRCADGWVALVYQEPDWPALCDLVGDERLRQPRFATRSERLQHARELAAIIEAAFLKLTRRELHRFALARRLPIGPVWSPRELQDDPQNLARDFLIPTQIDGRAAVMPRLPVIWGGRSFPAGQVAAPRARADMASS